MYVDEPKCILCGNPLTPSDKYLYTNRCTRCIKKIQIADKATAIRNIDLTFNYLTYHPYLPELLHDTMLDALQKAKEYYNATDKC